MAWLYWSLCNTRESKLFVYEKEDKHNLQDKKQYEDYCWVL